MNKRKRKLPNPTEEQLKIIQKCARAISSSNWIPGYEKKDIEQEAIIIGLESLDKYNQKDSLEKFLSVHMRHRLMSLRRSIHIIPGCSCGECLKCKNNHNKQRLQSPEDIQDYSEDHSISYKEFDSVQFQEISDYLDKNIPAEYREDYLKLLAGVNVVSTRKNKIKEIIKELLSESLK